MPSKTLIKQTKSAARKRYGRLPVMIWHTYLGKDSYRAYVIHAENKVVVRRGPLACSAKEAMLALRESMRAESKTKLQPA